MHWNDENMCLDTQIQYITCIEKPTKKNCHLKHVLELHVYQQATKYAFHQRLSHFVSC
jgi:hypothetical protein